MNISDNELDWIEFSEEVEKHIIKYVNTQYGDKNIMPAKHYTVEDCMKQIEKYRKRQGKNARPGQDKLDLIKIARWAQIAWEKLEYPDA